MGATASTGFHRWRITGAAVPLVIQQGLFTAIRPVGVATRPDGSVERKSANSVLGMHSRLVWNHGPDLSAVVEGCAGLGLARSARLHGGARTSGHWPVASPRAAAGGHDWNAECVVREGGATRTERTSL